jgi:hypothetical protein
MHSLAEIVVYLFWDVICAMTGDFILFLLSLGRHKFKWIPFCREDGYFANNSPYVSYIIGLLFWIFLIWVIYRIYS